MSSGVGVTAAIATFRAAGASLSAPNGRVNSFGGLSRAFGCAVLVALFGYIAAAATESAAVLEALALAMKSRAASDDTSAARMPAAAQAIVPARIREVKKEPRFL